MLVVWTRAKIRILVRRTFKEVFLPGYTCEGLGVHRTYLSPQLGWVISVLESGMAFPVKFKTCREAKAKAEQLLCIEGLWDNPLEAFARGLRLIDTTRVNQILGTAWKAHTIGSDVTDTLAYRKTLNV